MLCFRPSQGFNQVCIALNYTKLFHYTSLLDNFNNLVLNSGLMMQSKRPNGVNKLAGHFPFPRDVNL